MHRILRHARLPLLLLGLGAPAVAASQEPAVSSRLEARLDSILVALERPGRLEAALAAYREVEGELLARELTPGDEHYAAQQRLLAYVLLRQGNMLRQLERGAEALQLAARELAAARAAADPLTEARTEFSYGASLLADGQRERGLRHLERARELFAAHAGVEFRQGLGWYWIIRADLARAGLVPASADEMIGFADTALQLLLPIENWAGVARAYSARAHAHEQRGDTRAAAADRAEQVRYDALADRVDDG